MKKKEKKEYMIEKTKSLKNSMDEFLRNCLMDKTGEEMKKLSNYYSLNNRLYGYSLRNTAMIITQGGTLATSFKRWKENNRQVKKGEKAMYIYAPIIIKKEETEDEKKKIIKFFKLVPVFDIKQTVKIEENIIEDDFLAYKEESLTELSDDEYNLYLEKIQKIIDIPIEREFLQYGGARGFCSNSRIVINKAINNSFDAFKTTLHESAHYLFGHLNDDKQKEVKEVEAETVAFLTLSCLGKKHEFSELYVNSYINENVVNRIETNKILTLSDKLVKVLK